MFSCSGYLCAGDRKSWETRLSDLVGRGGEPPVVGLETGWSPTVLGCVIAAMVDLSLVAGISERPVLTEGVVDVCTWVGLGSICLAAGCSS